jgi:DNA repair protein RadC
MKDDKSFTVRDLPKPERPRERLRAFGPEALSAPELLALVIGRGIPGKSVLSIAQELVVRFGSIRGISEATMEELSAVKGIGPARAAQIKGCFELGRRQDLPGSPEDLGYDIRNPESVVKVIRGRIKDKAKEHFMLISLSTRNKIIGIHKVSVGTLNASLVHPREVFSEAIRRSASSVVLAHNHPSDDCEPSEEDLKITRRLVEAGKILGIEVLDHIVISSRSHLSFKERNLI